MEISSINERKNGPQRVNNCHIHISSATQARIILEWGKEQCSCTAIKGDRVNSSAFSHSCSFLQLLLNGTYDYMRHKILYVFLDHFPEGGKQDGWIADDYLRTFLTHNGMSRVVGAKPDDVFVINDADEIPAHEGLLFLKLFDGWTEPFAIHMRKVHAVSSCLDIKGFGWKLVNQRKKKTNESASKCL